MTDIELFAGAGGMALGLNKAGMEIKALIDSDHDCCKTLRQKDWNVIESDIAKVKLEYKDLDCLSGGAPCQSFSYAGKRLGLDDTRGTLFYYYAKFLNDLQPKFFIFENVKGLLTNDKKNTFKTVTNIFMDCGYRLYCKVLNANDYNVPQLRERECL